jgi:hypothetical protein
MIAKLVDQTRAVLCALSYQTESNARPVHINRISWFISRIEPSLNTQASLRILQLVRETQALAGGYWLPTPTRCVHIGSQDLLVSTLPSSEILRRWNQPILSAGVSRVLNAAPANVEFESLESWIRAPDTEQWTRKILNTARDSLLPANFIAGDLEVFVASDRRTGYAWEPGSRAVRSSESDQLVLCRDRTKPSTGNAFIARCAGGRLTHQASMQPFDRRRLTWGIALLAGHRTRATSREENGQCVFEVLHELPREELRLLRALATIGRGARGTTRYQVRAAFLSVIRPVLSRLGLDM